eukprot:m.324200 g.324200  ORF g.324200 m.324200 type:complete len:354 (-) comp20370_c0_seq3:313-1374(-)
MSALCAEAAMPTTLGDAACLVLGTANVLKKAELTAELAASHLKGIRLLPSQTKLPSEPDRPPSSRHADYKTKPGLKTTLHGIAHAEGYAIDLMWDLVARFAHSIQPGQDQDAFVEDWIRIAGEEALHFNRWRKLLSDMFNVTYGDLPTHSGLWEAAAQTTDDILSRLALVHLVHEARGLDTFPLTLRKIISYEQHTADTSTKAHGGEAGTCATRGSATDGQGGEADGGGICAQTLRMNAHDEVGHVGCAVKWFEYVCKQRRLGPPHEVFKKIVQERFKGDLAPPFNTELRDQAGMSREYYTWAGEGTDTKRDPKAQKQQIKAIEREMNIIRKTLQAQQRRIQRVHCRLSDLET